MGSILGQGTKIPQATWHGWGVPFPHLIAQLGKNPPAMWETPVQILGQEEGDLGSIPGLGRHPGKGKGYPLEYSGLENSMGRIVHGVAESDTTE